MITSLNEPKAADNFEIIIFTLEYDLKIIKLYAIHYCLSFITFPYPH